MRHELINLSEVGCNEIPVTFYRTSSREKTPGYKKMMTEKCSTTRGVYIFINNGDLLR